MKFKWLGKTPMVRRFFMGYLVLLFILFFIDPFISKHGELFWERLILFFPGYGFLSCILMFAVAKMACIILKRDAQYYEQ